MKKRIALLLAVTIISMAAFAGCGSGSQKDFAAVYVQGILDTLYLGQYNSDFLALTDYESEDQLAREYENGILAETDYFAYYFNVSTLSEKTRADLQELYKEIYSFSKYKVNPSTGAEGSYDVDVVISPIDVIQKVTQEDLPDYLESLRESFEDGAFEDLTEVEYEDAYALGIIALIKDRMTDIGYLEDQTLTVHVVKDAEDGLYYVQDDGLAQIDEHIIKY